MKGNDKVSVLVTCYNQEQFIEQALLSVVNQDYENLEIIVVDDGSTDGSKKIIERLAQLTRKIAPVFSERNMKVAGARNLGLTKCTGKYVALLDGDDLMLPEKISKQVAYLNAHKQYAVCTHDMELFNSFSGNKISDFSDAYDLVNGGIETMLSTN